MSPTAAAPGFGATPVTTRPLRIGVSACFFHADPERPIFKGKTLLYAEESMLDLVGRAGALALMVPRPTAPGPGVGDYVDLLDGLVLEGGSDVCPRTYGEEPLRPSWEGDEVRDRYEIELIHAFHDTGKPVLGICRGAQILNVAFGGTLYQDIATQVPGSADHRNWDAYDANRHEVDLPPGSWLSQLYGGAGRVTVNSVHHQAVRDVADGFDVEATSATDGIVEALRRPGPTFLAGVQWHPEFTLLDDPDQVPAAPVIDDFLAAAARAAALAGLAGATT